MWEKLEREEYYLFSFEASFENFFDRNWLIPELIFFSNIRIRNKLSSVHNSKFAGKGKFYL